MTVSEGPGGRLRRVRLHVGGAIVEMEWGDDEPAPPARPEPAAESPVVAIEPAEDIAGEKTSAAEQFVCAPMVGTFYRSPEPGAPPFVDVGEIVEPGQQVGILEAMKLMNSIEAEVHGRVVEILVPDAAPVEYEQRLIALDPLTT